MTGGCRRRVRGVGGGRGRGGRRRTIALSGAARAGPRGDRAGGTTRVGGSGQGPRPARGYARPSMPRSSIERRLSDVGERLRRLRAEREVLDAQLAHVADAADDARRDALVRGDRAVAREAATAARHRDRLRSERDRLSAEIARLEATVDELLDARNAGGTP